MMDIDDVVQATDRVHKTRVRRSVAARKQGFGQIAAAVKPHRRDLVDLAADETHVGSTRSEGELTRTIFPLGFIGDEVVGGTHLGATIDHSDASWGMGPRPDLGSAAEPIGFVSVFGASNFAFVFSVAGGDGALMLAAACPVVHKEHPAHPRLARRTADTVDEVLRTIGALESLFAPVEGDDKEVRLVRHLLAKVVAFTVSASAGSALFDLTFAYREPIPFFGELGSVNWAFLTPVAWERRTVAIADGCLASVRLGRGQFCTKPRILAVPSGVAATIIAAAKAGDEPALLLTPDVRDGYETSLSAFFRLACVKILECGASANTVPPLAILSATTETVITSPDFLEPEMFGPANVIVEYDDTTQLEQLAPLIGGQLAATVYAEPGEDNARLLGVFTERSGRIVWNGWPTGVSVGFAQNYDDPYAAAVDATSVDSSGIDCSQGRVTYQGVSSHLLSLEIRGANLQRIPQRVDGSLISPVARGDR